MFNFINRQLVALAAFAIFTCATAFGAYAEPPEGRPSTVVGAATVTDGDTIKVDGVKVRLNGFDTPERGRMCGRTDVYSQASAALEDFIGSSEVTCKLTGDKTYDRFVGMCFIGGKDIGDFMVDAGWGRDWKRFSGGKYAAAEKEARKAQRGLWGLSCSEELWGSRKYD